MKKNDVINLDEYSSFKKEAKDFLNALVDCLYSLKESGYDTKDLYLLHDMFRYEILDDDGLKILLQSDNKEELKDRIIKYNTALNDVRDQLVTAKDELGNEVKKLEEKQRNVLKSKPKLSQRLLALLGTTAMLVTFPIAVRVGQNIYNKNQELHRTEESDKSGVGNYSEFNIKFNFEENLSPLLYSLFVATIVDLTMFSMIPMIDLKFGTDALGDFLKSYDYLIKLTKNKVELKNALASMDKLDRNYKKYEKLVNTLSNMIDKVVLDYTARMADNRLKEEYDNIKSNDSSKKFKTVKREEYVKVPYYDFEKLKQEVLEGKELDNKKVH